MASPIGDTVTDTCTTFVIGAVLERVTHNLDPELPVREVTIVESEREIGICRSRYTTSGELRFHPRSRVKQIRTRIQVPHPPPSLSLTKNKQQREKESVLCCVVLCCVVLLVMKRVDDSRVFIFIFIFLRTSGELS